MSSAQAAAPTGARPPAVPQESQGTSTAAPPQPVVEKPVQIVSISEAGDSFTLDEAALGSVLDPIPRHMKVSVISIVGAFRTGKSFLLDLLLRYLRSADKKAMPKSRPSCTGDSEWIKQGMQQAIEGHAAPGEKSHARSAGFSWRSGRERCTTGIWVWSRPFYLQLPQQDSSLAPETVAVLLVDTQGMFDHETSNMLTANIFGLSTLFSSTQVYNVRQLIGEDNLQHLALFSEYGRMAFAAQQEAEAASAGSASAAPRAAVPFQHVQFLLRDSKPDNMSWFDPLNPDTLAADNAAIIESVLAQTHIEDLASTREQITSVFERISAFQLPSPGERVMEDPSFAGQLSQVRPVFLQALEMYTYDLFHANLTPKRVAGRAVTASELKTLMTEYCSAFTSGGGFPEATSLLTATAAANNANAVEECLLDYQDRIDAAMAGKGYCTDEVLEAVNKSARAEALDNFAHMANFGPARDIAEAKDKLLGSMDAFFERAEALNSERNPWKNFELYFFAMLLAGGAYVLRVLADFTCSPYSEVCRRGSNFFGFVYMSIFALMVVMAVATGHGAWTRARAVLSPLFNTAMATAGALVEANNVPPAQAGGSAEGGAASAAGRRPAGGRAAASLRRRRGVQE